MISVPLVAEAVISFAAMDVPARSTSAVSIRQWTRRICLMSGSAMSVSPNAEASQHTPASSENS